MESSDDSEILEHIVRRVFQIEDITYGTNQQAYRVRYRGHLLQPDSATAYDQLSALLKPYQLTPLFRVE